jgi:polyhydroxyalkanoate synthesis regulator phasin
MTDQIITIIDQIDSELNLASTPNLAYLRAKIMELIEEVNDLEPDKSEINKLRDELSDLENELDDYKGFKDDVEYTLNLSDSDEDKLKEIRKLLEHL